MARSDFTLFSVTNQFKLKTIDRRFCESLPPADPQPSMLDLFNQSLPLAQVAYTQKARSELLVSPILIEARRIAGECV